MVALGFSVWNWQQAEVRARQAEEQAEERARLTTEAAIKRHEEAMVEKYRPALSKIARDFGLQNPGPPHSVADMLVLLIRLLEGISH